MSKLVMSILMVLAVVALVGASSPARADVCLMAYVTGPCEYHYESSEYYTVASGHPLYDPLYDRGGEVLIDINTDEIAMDVYQAPGLNRFVLDNSNQGYFAIGTTYALTIDGFNNNPTTYSNVIIVFDRINPEGCVPLITVNGNPVQTNAALGYYYPIGDLVVSTPTAEGNNYSDVITVSVEFQLCRGIRAWAFADENYNAIHDSGGECFTAFSHDVTVPVEETSWGHIKSLYR